MIFFSTIFIEGSGNTWIILRVYLGRRSLFRKTGEGKKNKEHTALHLIVSSTIVNIIKNNQNIVIKTQSNDAKNHHVYQKTHNSYIYNILTISNKKKQNEKHQSKAKNNTKRQNLHLPTPEIKIITPKKLYIKIGTNLFSRT